MLDIDHFKDINDRYGHQSGDRVLAAVSSVMLTEARTIDVIGRYGGEEFLIIMPETTLEGAVVLAERIRIAIESLQIAGIHHAVTASLGISFYSGESLLDFIDCADNRLYAAKNAGRNRVMYS